MKVAIALTVTLVLSGCGMTQAVKDTGQMFDKYGCIARDFKGEPPCKPQ
jgi:hypothetical protein